MKKIKLVVLSMCFFSALNSFTIDDLTPKTMVDEFDFLLAFATSTAAHASTDDWIMPILYSTATTGFVTSIVDPNLSAGSGWTFANSNIKNKIFYSAEGEALGIVVGKTARYTVKGACWLMWWLKRAIFGCSHARELAEARKQLHELAERVRLLENAEKNSESRSSAIARVEGPA